MINNCPTTIVSRILGSCLGKFNVYIITRADNVVVGHNLDRQNVDGQNVDRHNVEQTKCRTDKMSTEKMSNRHNVDKKEKKIYS